MKKILIILFSISSFAYGGILAVGQSSLSNNSFLLKSSPEEKIGINDTNSYYLEFYFLGEDGNILSSPVDVGVGFKYADYTAESNNKDFAAITTFYLVARGEWDAPIIKPYFQLKGGYPYVFDKEFLTEYGNPNETQYNDLKGKEYISIGLGVRVFIADVSINYEINNYKFKSFKWTDEQDVEQRNVSLNMGIKF